MADDSQKQQLGCCEYFCKLHAMMRRQTTNWRNDRTNGRLLQITRMAQHAYQEETYRRCPSEFCGHVLRDAY